MTRELLLGCGARRDKQMWSERREWSQLTTLDINPEHSPDVLWDLNELPLPFDADSFDEVHAYEVLEHLGAQGDWRAFFAQFSELWRVMKPGALLFASCPSLTSLWLWGDPGHTRAISPGSILFLSQAEYSRQVGKTPMTDYRFCYRADFEPAHVNDDGELFRFVLRAVKPSGAPKST